MALKTDLIADLTSELQKVDPDFDSAILEIKVNLAIKKVQLARHYPEDFSDTTINKDLEKYYTNIRDIALYEYNKIGADFESNYTSNKVTRTFIDESKLYKGIRPIARL